MTKKLYDYVLLSEQQYRIYRKIHKCSKTLQRTAITCMCRPWRWHRLHRRTCSNSVRLIIHHSTVQCLCCWLHSLSLHMFTPSAIYQLFSQSDI